MKRVLVVDDEPEIRTIVGQVLQEAGYTVDTAANGAEALARVRAQPPDGVLLDLHMPVMDGHGFLRACRAEPAYAKVPVAVFSTVPSAAQVAQTLGVQAHISKPFDLDELLDVVARLVEQPLGQANPPATPRWPAPVASWPYAPDLHRHVATATRVEAATLARHANATRWALDTHRGVAVRARACLTRAASRIEHSRELVGAPASEIGTCASASIRRSWALRSNGSMFGGMRMHSHRTLSRASTLVAGARVPPAVRPVRLELSFNCLRTTHNQIEASRQHLRQAQQHLEDSRALLAASDPAQPNVVAR